MKGRTRISAKDLAYIALFASLMVLCAWISIPFAVPFTMQTFAVMLAAGILGTTRGLAATVLYLALGMIGIPVFSGFTGGIGVLAGPTGGYLIGFMFAVSAAGGLIRLLGRRFWALCVSMAVGMMLCYLFGTLWYMGIYVGDSNEMGFAAVAMQCVVPFILPDAAKILLAAWMTKRFEKIVRIGT